MFTMRLSSETRSISSRSVAIAGSGTLFPSSVRLLNVADANSQMSTPGRSLSAPEQVCSPGYSRWKRLYGVCAKRNGPQGPGAIHFKLADLGVSKVFSELDAFNTLNDSIRPPEAIDPAVS